jgi:hypothetical protein
MAQTPSLAMPLIVGLVSSALAAYWGLKQLGPLDQVPEVGALVAFLITAATILKKPSPPKKRYPCPWCGRC